MTKKYKLLQDTARSKKGDVFISVGSDDNSFYFEETLVTNQFFVSRPEWFAPVEDDFIYHCCKCNYKISSSFGVYDGLCFACFDDSLHRVTEKKEPEFKIMSPAVGLESAKGTTCPSGAYITKELFANETEARSWLSGNFYSWPAMQVINISDQDCFEQPIQYRIPVRKS